MIKGMIGVVIGLTCYIVITQLVSSLITGTTTADTISTDRQRQWIVALKSNLHRTTRQIRGKLNSVMSRPIAELTQGLNLVNCGETRWRGSQVETLTGSWYSPVLLERVETSVSRIS